MRFSMKADRQREDNTQELRVLGVLGVLGDTCLGPEPSLALCVFSF